MSFIRQPIEQIDPPRSPRETLPTMYDLPSEDPEEPGLPDEFHDLQPQLLSRTFRCRHYPPERVFTGTDLNLYYDVRHPLWHKRPDWFVVVGVPRLYDEQDLRNSYVIWQEGVDPFVVVELLSSGTEKEDLGPYAEDTPVIHEKDAEIFQMGIETPPEIEPLKRSGGFRPLDVPCPDALVGTRPAPRPRVPSSPGHLVEVSAQNNTPEAKAGNGQMLNDTPPGKWQVYEQILRVPYYVVFSRYTNRLRFFQLVGGHYQELAVDVDAPRAWIPELELGIGRWQGEFEGIERLWLRWYDEQRNWVLTDTEQQRQRAERLAERLRQAGIDPDEI